MPHRYIGSTCCRDASYKQVPHNYLLCSLVEHQLEQMDVEEAAEFAADFL